MKDSISQPRAQTAASTHKPAEAGSEMMRSGARCYSQSLIAVCAPHQIFLSSKIMWRLPSLWCNELRTSSWTPGNTWARITHTLCCCAFSHQSALRVFSLDWHGDRQIERLSLMRKSQLYRYSKLRLHSNIWIIKNCSFCGYLVLRFVWEICDFFFS